MRISVVGTSGAGKTTVAARVAAQLGVPHLELDAVHHGPNWTPIADADFRQRVADFVARDSWVIDGNYHVVRDLVWGRATTVAWIDPPFPLIMAQVIWRSVSRAITKKELWNGNYERASAWLDADHPIRWAFRTHRRRQAEYYAAMQDDSKGDSKGDNASRWVHLQNRRQISRWLDTLAHGT